MPQRSTNRRRYSGWPSSSATTSRSPRLTFCAAQYCGTAPVPSRRGVQMLARARELAEHVGVRSWNPLIDIEAAKAKADLGDLDEAIATLRGLVDEFVK